MKNFKLILAVTGLFLLGACNQTNNQPAGATYPARASNWNQQLAATKAQLEALANAQAQKDQELKNAAAKTKEEAQKKADAEKEVNRCDTPDVFKGLEKLPTVDVSTLKGDYQLDEVHVYLATEKPDTHAGAMYARLKTSGSDPTDTTHAQIGTVCKNYNDNTPVNTKVTLAEVIHAQSGRITIHDLKAVSGELDDENSNYPTVASVSFDSLENSEFTNEAMDAPFNINKYWVDVLPKTPDTRIMSRSDGQAGFQVVYGEQSDLKNGNDTYPVNEWVLISYKPTLTN